VGCRKIASTQSGAENSPALRAPPFTCAGKDGGRQKGRKRPGQAERKLEDRLPPLSNARAPVVEMDGF